jgi:transcription antitermination factor NusB
MLEPAADELNNSGRVFPPDRSWIVGCRAFAFQALYDRWTRVTIRRTGALNGCHGVPEDGPDPYSPERALSATQSQNIVRGVLTNRTPIDALIQQRAPLWPLSQMSAVDRNVLRIGLYESLYGNATVPLRTAINEAVELGKLFGSETSAKFVNGVLGRAVEANASGQALRSESAHHAPPSDPTMGRTASVEHEPRADASDTTTTHPATSAG